jgi:DMSO/TMAO reductase YedYZ molybdopterin-dependent catalytic subunit
VALFADALVHTFATAVPFTPVSVAQAVIRGAPGEVDAFFINRFQHFARPAAVIGAGVGFVLSGVLLGLLLPSLRRRLGGRTALAVALLSLPPFVLALALYRREPGFVSLPVYVLALVPIFALSVAAATRTFGLLTERRAEAPTDPVRRQVVTGMWLSGVGFLAGWASLGRLLFRRPNPGRLPLHLRAVSPAPPPTPNPGDTSFRPTPGLVPEITPNDSFYVVNEELIYPDIDPDTWSLSVGGQVERPYRLTYRQLTDMPAVEQFQTLECISNRIGGPLISTARWAGIPMPDLLKRAGVRPGAVEVVSRAVDGFADSIPLEDAMRRTTLVAIGMNGRVLPREHGFPARLLAPGYYGMKQPKWLGSIEVMNRPFTGYWEARGWIKEAVVRTMSRIDIPRPGSVAGVVKVAGVAFAGDRGISRVEVSTDGGRTWGDAQLKTALSPFTWRLWRFRFTPLSPEPYELVVRATDGSGAVQTRAVAPPEYSGATGYHEVTVRGQ